MSDAVSWCLYNLPDTPPWHCEADADTAVPPAKTGNHRRPLIHPPPKHTRTGPPGLEFATGDSGNAELRMRLEEQHREDKRRDGLVVYEDMGQYQPRSKWDEAEGGDPTSLSSVRTLQFESRFESGNLQRAVKVGATEYDLYLRTDKNSGHVQWYYFMVRNMKHGVPYVFNIVNFVKNRSLYNSGLRPLMYSEKEARSRRGGVGWHRTGSDCAYFRRGNRYALTFTMTFKYEGDTAFFAHCYPYTYTDSQTFLSSLLKEPARSATYKRRELCRSLAGNTVDLLEIGDHVHDPTAPRRASILLSARVHPGETQASWAIESCIEFLTSSLPEARLLRSRFTIYVVPMLNPDGVINGHYRCSMSGNDLNRVWANPDKGRHPCIWHIRDLVRELSTQGLSFFCDFHGHSVKKNAFMYGCSAPGNQSYKPNSTKAIPTAAMFPLLLDDISQAFSFPDCNFRVSRSKMNTGRVVVNREFGVSNSYTIEISFFGHEVGGCMVHFKIDDLQQIGKDFAAALVKYHFPTQYLSMRSLGVRDATNGVQADVEQCECANQVQSKFPPHADTTRGKDDNHDTLRSASSTPAHQTPINILPSSAEVTAESCARHNHYWSEDYSDNFIRRRERIEQDIRRCEADLKELTASSQASISADSKTKTMHCNDAGAVDPAHTMPELPAVGTQEPDLSEGDSDNSSSDHDEMLVGDGLFNSARRLGTSEEGEDNSDNSSESNMDPEVARVIAAASAGQPAFRLKCPITAKDLLNGCEEGFLPQLTIKKFDLPAKFSAPPSSREQVHLQDHVRDLKDGAGKPSSSEFVRCIPAYKRAEVGHTRQKADWKPSFEVTGSISGLAFDNFETASESRETGSLPASANRHPANPAHDGMGRQGERSSHPALRESGPLSSKLAYLCAAVEGAAAEGQKFPCISKPTHRGLITMRFSEMTAGALMKPASPASPAPRLSLTAPLDADLQRLAQRLGNLADGEVPAGTAPPRRGVEHSVWGDSDNCNVQDLASRMRVHRQVSSSDSNRAVASDRAPMAPDVAAMGERYCAMGRAGAVTKGPVTACNPQPPARYDTGTQAQALNRAWQRRIAKARPQGRPAPFSLTTLTRPGAPTQSMQRRADADVQGLAIISSARGADDSMQAGAGAMAAHRSLQAKNSTAPSSSPRSLANRIHAGAEEPTNENLTFLRLLSVLKRKPE